VSLARTHKPGVGGSNPPLATKNMNIQSKKSSWWSTFKNSYLRDHNLKKFYNSLNKKNIPPKLNETLNFFIKSESYEWSSKYWRKMVIDQLNLISIKGLDKSKEILGRNYFLWTYLNDSLVINACKLIQKNQINFNVDLFKKHKNFSYEESINHNIILLLLYENIKNKPFFKNLDEILNKQENFYKDKPSLNLEGRKISQDVLNSLLEYTKIEKLTDNIKNKKNNFLEIGAGSGRTAQTILSINNNIKYIIADIPPALNVAYDNLKGIFPEKKISFGFDIDNQDNFLKFYEQNEIMMIFPHQIKFIPNKFIDTSIAVDCLHEMEEKIVKRYMNYFENKSQSLYFKVWEIAALPNSFYKNYSVHDKDDYYIKESWVEIFKEKCIFPSNYYELGYKF